MFKIDAINKYHRVLKEILEQKSYLTLYMEDNCVEYFKELAPLLKARLSQEELNVMIEDMCLRLAGNNKEMFYRLKNIFDSLFIFQIEPEVVLGGAYETSGLTGIGL